MNKPQRVTVRDVARRAHWSPGRLRQQIHRGAVKVERDPDGSVWIPIDEAERIVHVAESARQRDQWANQLA